MSDPRDKTPLERVVDGDPLYQGDVRAAVKELHERLTAVEAARPVAKKTVPRKAVGG